MIEGKQPRPLCVVDLTSEQADPPVNEPPDHKIFKGKVARRLPHSVDGIVIHQTATPFGVTKEAVKASNGDAILAKHRRALKVAAHMTCFDTGYAVLAHPLDWYVYHGNSLNARSLGIEIEGAYPEKMKAPLLTAKHIQAAKDGLTYLVREGKRKGMPLRFIWAHRQSSMTRPGDPGEEIWKTLVLDFAVPELGLITQPELVIGGQPLPDYWSKKR